MKRRIYLASSWRNDAQPALVKLLRHHGHEVYDFRHPRPEDNGFSWGDIAAGWQGWTAAEFREGLNHPTAVAGFASDWEAMLWADTGVLLLPCGRSAHLEAGYFVGAGKRLHILLAGYNEPELMYRMATSVCVTTGELLRDLEDE